MGNALKADLSGRPTGSKFLLTLTLTRSAEATILRLPPGRSPPHFCGAVVGQLRGRERHCDLLIIHRAHSSHSYVITTTKHCGMNTRPVPCSGAGGPRRLEQPVPKMDILRQITIGRASELEARCGKRGFGCPGYCEIRNTAIIWVRSRVEGITALFTREQRSRFHVFVLMV